MAAITNLRGGAGVLELFSFAAPTKTPAGQGDLGLRAIGVRGPDAELTGPGGVRVKLSPSSAATPE